MFCPHSLFNMPKIYLVNGMIMLFLKLEFLLPSGRAFRKLGQSNGAVRKGILLWYSLVDQRHVKCTAEAVLAGRVYDWMPWRNVRCTVRLERCFALLTTRSSIERNTMNKNWIKQLHTLPVLNFNRCLRTEHSEKQHTATATSILTNKSKYRSLNVQRLYEHTVEECLYCESVYDLSA
jgi:hypothetical protein